MYYVLTFLTGIFKQMAWSAIGTMAGGAIGGPVGGLVGGVIGKLWGDR